MAIRNLRIATCSIVVATALLTGAASTSVAAAQGPSGGRGWREGPARGLMLGVPLHALNLTADQQNQIQSILSTYRASTRPIFQQLRDLESGLSDRLLAPGQIQAADLQSQLQQIGQLRGQLLGLSAQATVDIRNLLTPEQLATAAQTKDKLRDLRSQMRQLVDPSGHR